MFLQNFSTWKPFRAVAAFMLVLVMATACQETAQVATNSLSGNSNQHSDISSQAASFKERAAKGELTQAEQEMVIAFVQAPAARKLIEINNASTMRVYNAVKAGKGKALQQAFKAGNEEEAQYLLGYTKEETNKMTDEVKNTYAELFKQLGKSKDLFVFYANVKEAKCLTCGKQEQFLQIVQKMETTNLNTFLLPVPPENLKVNYNSGKNGSMQQGCTLDEWWNVAAYAGWVSGCFVLAAACVAGGAALGAPLGPVGVAVMGILSFYPCALGMNECVALGQRLICG